MKKFFNKVIYRGRSEPVYLWEYFLVRVLIGSILIYLALSVLEAVTLGSNL